ncbi:endonuclease/exonuclease/phosphatase family protein [Sandaracinobacteroides sp. A072]|uniref:endonuclease/exonuclease/phosphatase family protein n=1 Tax=Sandaracinobacteroides sp. A072 TaxID=3461146 RepID=UPI0040422965
MASYNIRKAVGSDLRRRPDRIMTVLSEIDASIAVVQEADRRFGERHTVLPAGLLAEHGWRAVPFENALPNAIGWHGNAVLMRDGVELLRHATLTLPVLEPRGAVLVDLAVAGAPVRIVGMHLDLSGLWRRRQAHAILEHIAAQPEQMPTIMMGDLNEWRVTAGCIADFARTHKVLPTGPTFPAGNPVARLDRVFVSNEMEVEGAGVHQSPQSRVSSDHLPLWLKVRLPRGSRRPG